MKTILAISIITILLTGVVAQVLQEAYALKSDTSKKMSPKAFGEKTINKIILDDSQKNQKSGFETLKKEQTKSYKKLIAQNNAKQILDKLYRLGPTVPTLIPATSEDLKRSEALEIAQRFVVDTPTFAFDGDLNTLDTISVNLLTSPYQHLIKIAFDSAHGGYGNREGQILTQVITPHTIELIVSEGVVISAITDQKWDELNNQYILDNSQKKLQSGNELVIPFKGEVENYPSFVKALKSKGLLVKEIETIDDSFFSVPTKVISVSGIDLQIYEFNSRMNMEAAKEKISFDGTQIGLSFIKWMDSPHFYGKNTIIVQYIGNNPEILNLLDSLLGNQFAGM